jgi:phage/plasmid-like protein (TIGR03299 family)
MNIGTDISDAKNVEHALRLAGLDWTVDKNPTFYTKDDPDGMIFKKSKKFVSISRPDIGEEFAHVTDKYQVVQNSQAFAFLDVLKNEGAEFWRAGEFRHGRKCYVIMSFGSPLTLSTGDTIVRSIIVSTSHDATSGIRANWLPVRIVCSNVIGAVLREAPVVFRHSQRLENGVDYEDVEEMLFRGDRYFEHLKESAEYMLRHSFTEDDLDQLIAQVFDSVQATGSDSRRARVNVDYLYDRIHESFTRGMGTDGRNRFDAYNAVCEYLDHYRPIGNSFTTNGDNVEGQLRPIVQERHFNSVLSTNRFGGIKLRTKTLELLMN